MSKHNSDAIPVLTVKYGRGIYFPHGNESEVMFEHLLAQTEYENNRSHTDDIESLKFLAKLHGWKVKVIRSTKDDFEDEC